MAEFHEKGKVGEDIACEHLAEHGYTIREKNWTFGPVEVDIIAEGDGELIIAEVKTRASSFYGEPQVFVDRKKQQHLIRAANNYVRYHGIDKEVRFDVLAVVLNEQLQKVHHIEQAFGPQW